MTKKHIDKDVISEVSQQVKRANKDYKEVIKDSIDCGKTKEEIKKCDGYPLLCPRCEINKEGIE